MAKTGGKSLAGNGWQIHNLDVLADKGAGGTVDLAFGDPPYNYGVDYGTGKKADQLAPEDYHVWLCRWVRAACNRLRGGGSLWLLLPDEWVAEAAVFCSWTLKLERRNWIKWHETFGTHQPAKFGRCSRHLLYFVKPGGRATFNADAIRVASARQEVYGDKRANPAGKVPDDVWTYSRVCGTFAERVADVPTQLPEDLLTRVVLACTNAGDRVLEYFVGSGSMGRVAVRAARVYEGWEKDGPTAELAATRIAAVEYKNSD